MFPRNALSTVLWRAVLVLTVLLIVKVTVEVVWGYRNYFPPNFESDFLRGRERYFNNGYQTAFYAHIASGPVSLLLGMLLLSQRYRLRFPAWHRRLGRIQGMNVLLLVVPSGLWMAWYATAGRAAAIAFAVLATFTAACVLFGWRSAVRKRFAEHRRWMSRSFLLLCSAVVIRVLGGLGTVLGVDAPWFDSVASWVSWLVPLGLFELSSLRKRRVGWSRVKPGPAPQSASAETVIASRRLPAPSSSEVNWTLPSTKSMCRPPE